MPEKITDDYLKGALKANAQREGVGLDKSMVNDIMPEEHDIKVNRVFQTKDPIILEYYYNLARKGEFGKRVGYLISQDAYGKIPSTNEVTKLPTEEKIDNIAQTVSHITRVLQRNQRLTEASLSSQSKSYAYINNLGGTVKHQGILLEAIKSILINKGNFTDKEVTEILTEVHTTLKNGQE